MAFNVVKRKEMAGGLCKSVAFYSSGSNVKSFCVLLRASGQFSLFLPRATHPSWHGKYVVRFLVQTVTYDRAQFRGKACRHGRTRVLGALLHTRIFSRQFRLQEPILANTNHWESVLTISELKQYILRVYPSKMELHSNKRPRAKAFFGRRIVYCPNSTAITQFFELLKLSRDIRSNPGPAKEDAQSHSRPFY